MSDEEQGDPTHFSSPQEYLKFVQRQQDQHLATSESIRHELESFLSTLSKENLMVLGTTMVVCADSPETVHYLIGRIAGELNSRYNVCPACGKNHDEILAEMARPLNEPKMQHPSSVSSEDHNSELEEWNLVAVSGVLYCKNCKIRVSSLEDRKLRPKGVDGCTGCQQKSRWG